MIFNIELKCSMCGKKADGVCALCNVTRYCVTCFEDKHKISLLESNAVGSNPEDIHKLTFYV